MASGLPPPPTRGEQGGFAWTAWYNQLYTLLNTAGSVSWALVDKAGSSIADLQTKNHNLLTAMQGGTTGEYYHLSAADYNTVHAPTYGLFYSSASQTVTSANTATAVTFNSTQVSNNVAVGSPTSRIVVSTAGTYRVDVDLQISKANASTSTVDFWLAVNGTNVANSASTLTLSGNGVRVATGHVQVMTLAVSDYIEVFFSSADSQMQVTATGTQTSPTRPAAPSARISVEQLN